MPPRRRQRAFAALALSIFAIAACVAFSGCASSPAVTADTGALNAATTQSSAQIGALQSQLAADEAALNSAVKAAATQPAGQPAPQVTALQNQIAADESALAAMKAQSASQLAALQGQLAADEAAAKAQSAQVGTQIAQTIAAVIPSPFGGIATSLIGLAGVGLVAYFGHASVASTNTTAQASSANHTAQITAAIQAVADSVPVSALPANLRPIAAVAVKAVDDVAPLLAPVVAGGQTPPAPAVAVGVAPAGAPP